MEVQINDFNLKLRAFYNDDSLVVDGILDFEIYKKASHKILWVLKEPYGDGDFNYPEYIQNFSYKTPFPTSGNMWRRITYVNYGILNDFKNWDEFPHLDQDENVFLALRSCALINLKKIPGETKSQYTVIKKHYELAKELIHEQIELINPSIIICGNTFQYIKDFYNTEPFNEDNDFGYSSGEKLFINAYHPSSFKNQKEYCNNIINLSKIWNEDKAKFLVK